MKSIIKRNFFIQTKILCLYVVRPFKALHNKITKTIHLNPKYIVQ